MFVLSCESKCEEKVYNILLCEHKNGMHENSTWGYWNGDENYSQHRCATRSSVHPDANVLFSKSDLSRHLSFKVTTNFCPQLDCNPITNLPYLLKRNSSMASNHETVDHLISNAIIWNRIFCYLHTEDRIRIERVCKRLILTSPYKV